MATPSLADFEVPIYRGQEHLTVELGGEFRSAAIDYVMGEPLQGGEVTTLVLPGYGETYGAAEKAAQVLGNIGIRSIVPLIPLNEFPNDPKWYTAATIASIGIITSKEVGLFPQTGKIPSISHSAGSAQWALTREEIPELFGDTALLAPTGVGSASQEWQAMGPKEKSATLRERFVDNAIHSFNHADVSGSILSGGEVSKQILADLIRLRLLTKFNMMANDTTVPRAVVAHAQNNRVRVTLGLYDTIVPPREAIESIHQAAGAEYLFRRTPVRKPEVKIEPISHVHALTTEGQHQIQDAGNWLTYR